MPSAQLSRNAARIASAPSFKMQLATKSRNWSLFSRTKSESSSATSRDSSSASQKSDDDAVRLSGEAHFDKELGKQQSPQQPAQKKKKTMAQLDEELRLAMEGAAGDGGESGVELEDGKPVAMRRGVRDNMFRYI